MDGKSTYNLLVIATALIVIIGMLFQSCTKEERENKRSGELAGTWEMIHMTLGEPHTTWTFDSASYTLTQFIEDQGYTTSDYSLKLDNYKYYITIDSLYWLINGKYLILKLTDEILVVERVEWTYNMYPFLRREFIKLD